MNRPVPDDPNLQTLLDEAQEFGFMQAVRFLANLHPNAPAPGSTQDYDQERVLFRHDASLSFGTSDISKIEQQDGRYIVQSNFLGASGKVSPLPQYMTEALAQPGEDFELSRRYLDIFHHRLYALLFRGLNERDLPIQSSQDARSPWINRLICLLGIDRLHRDALVHLDDQALLRMAPLLSTNAKPRARIQTGINLLLTPFLRAPDNTLAHATIHDFEGQWNAIERDALVRLGQANHALGQSSILGQTIEHPACRARIEISPLHPAQQRHFQKGGKANRQLGELLALCLQTPVEFELDLRVRYGPLDHCTLGRSKLSLDAVLPGKEHAPLRRIQVPLPIPHLGQANRRA